MLAKLSRDLPISQDLIYEPKWDGFRCVVFREQDRLELTSRNERPLTRYFPELAEQIGRASCRERV
jgi:ATP-dependent DNA ligase